MLLQARNHKWVGFVHMNTGKAFNMIFKQPIIGQRIDGLNVVVLTHLKIFHAMIRRGMHTARSSLGGHMLTQ